MTQISPPTVRKTRTLPMHRRQALWCAIVLTASVAGPLPSARAQDKHAHEHAHAPQHGGIVVEVKDVDYELVAKPDVLSLYLRDHGKPVEIAGARAKLTLLTRSRKTEAALEPVGDHLQAKGRFEIAAGTRIVALVTRGGKTASVRFVLK